MVQAIIQTGKPGRISNLQVSYRAAFFASSGFFAEFFNRSWPMAHGPIRPLAVVSAAHPATASPIGQSSSAVRTLVASSPAATACRASCCSTTCRQVMSTPHHPHALQWALFPAPMQVRSLLCGESLPQTGQLPLASKSSGVPGGWDGGLGSGSGSGAVTRMMPPGVVCSSPCRMRSSMSFICNPAP